MSQHRGGAWARWTEGRETVLGGLARFLQTLAPMSPPQVLFVDEARMRLLGQAAPADHPHGAHGAHGARWALWERLRALPARVLLRWVVVVAAAPLCPPELTAMLALLMLCAGRLVDEVAAPAGGAAESRIPF